MTENTQATTRVVGTMRSLNGTGAVRMEDRYDTDIDDLWSALTEPQRLARWIGDVEGDLRLGGEFQARFTSSWEGPGRVDVCEPPRRLLVTLEPGTADETVVEAELVADGEQTRLVIEERGLPVDSLPAYGAGLAGARRGPRRATWPDGSPRTGGPGGPSSPPPTASSPSSWGSRGGRMCPWPRNRPTSSSVPSLAGAKAAESLRDAGARRPGRPRRRRDRPPLRAAAAVQGLPDRQGRAGQDLRPRPRTGTPVTTSSCASAPPSPGSTASGRGRSSAGGERLGYDRCCSPPAPSRAGWTCRAPTWRASTTCAARRATRTCCARRSAGRRPAGRRRGRLDRAGGGRGGPGARRRGDRRRAAADPAARRARPGGRPPLRPAAPRARRRPSHSGPGSRGSRARTAW